MEVTVISTIAIYARKSKFTGKGESTENQVKLCKEYAYNHFQVGEIILYEDEGYSGGNTDRPKYKEMMEASNKKKFDVIICYRLDRISRNIADFTSLIETLLDNNIDFVSIREQFDTSTPMGRAMMYISSVFAQLERETIAERIKDNMYELARSGRWLGGKTPMGYISKEVSYKDKDGIERKMYILSTVEKELNQVKTLYNKYLELGSLTQLESWTLENNIKTKTGKYFDKSILKVILSNPVYAIADKNIYKYFKSHDSDIADTIDEFDGKNGLMVYNKHDERKGNIARKDKSDWIVAIGKHKGVIHSNDWIKVQQQLIRNSKKAPRSGTSEVGLLTPLLTCKNCGSKMRVITSRKNNKVYYYYKCLLKERSRSTKCNTKNLNGRKADKYVIDKIKELGSLDIDVYEYLKKMESRIIESSPDDKSQKEELIDELERYKKSVSNLTLQLAESKGSSVSKYIIEQIEKFDKKIKELELRLKNMEHESKVLNEKRERIVEYLELIKHFSNNVDNLKFKEKNKLFARIVKVILWNGEKLNIKIQQ
ncbi:recombinase family protein [Clostridium sp. D2Q-11]|uniref:Recombinase family protein n=1 Tax=Anaeromonas frigoriresistens TaxID=2683708 RepID=A0A942Z891_9FIRM|nr:recombinase family protein [Anaeromonas frigoriresistens]MBS4537695.1 recombinase family protein [Anaeromonas frigoriresistens]